MRIRKNAKVSSLHQLLAGGGGSSSSSHASGGGGGDDQQQLLQLLLQPHVCLLNQSPWDVPDLALYSPPPHLPLQYQREDSFTGTVSSLNDSAPALESFPEEAEPNEETPPGVDNDEDFGHGYRRHHEKEKDSVKGRKGTTTKRRKKSMKGDGGPYCQKNDGEAWHCKNEAADGSSMCDYHLSNRCPASASGGNNYDNATGKKAAGTRRARKKGAASNPYEFYYYTGFGPSWGRRRGGGANVEGNGRNGNFGGVTDNISSITGPPYMTPSPANEFGFAVNGMDIVEEEDEDEEESGGGGKKRMRKPVKARSLKSLM